MTTLRVMTVNLWGDRVDPEGLASVLRRVDPDVLAVQELEAHVVGVIAGHFPHHALDPATDALGSGIATRLPTEMRRLPMPHRHGWAALVSVGEPARTVQVVSVHLLSPLKWPWRRTVAIRRRQVAALERHLFTDDAPSMIVGDLNATPMWPAYRRMVGSMGFADAALVSGRPGRTWRLRGAGPPMLRIDHGLVRGLRALATTTVPVPGSDHLGVVIDVALEHG